MARNPINQAPPPNIDPANPNIHRWDNGLVLFNEFISEEEEAAIVAEILKDNRWRGHGKRLTLHFGPHFDYTTFGVSDTAATPPPSFLTDLLPRLATQDRLPDQFTVQYYPPGGGIPPHVDTHSAFHEALYSLSLGSTVPMCFKKCGEKEARRIRKPKRSLLDKCSAAATETPIIMNDSPESNEKSRMEDEDVDTDVEEWELFLPPRSLLLMKGPSRYGFTHKIRGRKFDVKDGRMVAREGRYSITMRTIKKGEEVGCSCDFPGVCDAQIDEERVAQNRLR
jgi:alkylated DNA repair protein alkB family protein 8